MSNEALENAVYQRMAAEQKAFEAELLKLTPQEILQKAHESLLHDTQKAMDMQEKMLSFKQR